MQADGQRWGCGLRGGGEGEGGGEPDISINSL